MAAFFLVAKYDRTLAEITDQYTFEIRAYYCRETWRAI